MKWVGLRKPKKVLVDIRGAETSEIEKAVADIQRAQAGLARAQELLQTGNPSGMVNVIGAFMHAIEAADNLAEVVFLHSTDGSAIEEVLKECDINTLSVYPLKNTKKP